MTIPLIQAAILLAGVVGGLLATRMKGVCR
jgi:hypothetical protein